LALIPLISSVPSCLCESPLRRLGVQRVFQIANRGEVGVFATKSFDDLNQRSKSADRLDLENVQRFHNWQTAVGEFFE